LKKADRKMGGKRAKTESGKGKGKKRGKSLKLGKGGKRAKTESGKGKGKKRGKSLKLQDALKKAESKLESSSAKAKKAEEVAASVKKQLEEKYTGVQTEKEGLAAKGKGKKRGKSVKLGKGGTKRATLSATLKDNENTDERAAKDSIRTKVIARKAKMQEVKQKNPKQEQRGDKEAEKDDERKLAMAKAAVRKAQAKDDEAKRQVKKVETQEVKVKQTKFSASNAKASATTALAEAKASRNKTSVERLNKKSSKDLAIWHKLRLKARKLQRTAAPAQSNADARKRETGNALALAKASLTAAKSAKKVDLRALKKADRKMGGKRPKTESAKGKGKKRGKSLKLGKGGKRAKTESGKGKGKKRGKSLKLGKGGKRPKRAQKALEWFKPERVKTPQSRRNKRGDLDKVKKRSGRDLGSSRSKHSKKSKPAYWSKYGNKYRKYQKRNSKKIRRQFFDEPSSRSSSGGHRLDSSTANGPWDGFEEVRSGPKPPGVVSLAGDAGPRA